MLYIALTTLFVALVPALQDSVATPPVPEPRVFLTGQITDNAGGGHAGVRVVARYPGNDSADGPLIAEVTTSQLGDFELKAADAVSGAVSVTFSCDSFAPSVHHLTIDPAAPPPFLADSLRGNLKLTGSVLAALDEKPIANAAVRLRVQFRDYRATTDERGAFALDGLSPGESELMVEADGYGHELQKLDSVVRTDPLRILLQPQRILNLTALDDTGRPVHGVILELYADAHEDFRTLVTDVAGKASVRGLRFDTREIHLRYTHDDHASLVGFDEIVSLTPDTVTTEHELRLVRAGRVSGKVLDAGGQPISGARVTAGLDANPNNPRAFSSFDGHYEIKGVPPGQSVATVHASGYAPELHPVDVRPGDAATADFALKQGLTVTGFVRVDSGEPHVGVEVEAVKWRGFNTLGLRGFTDKEGRFVINDAPHDEFDMSVSIWRGGVLTQTVRAGSQDPVIFVTPAVRAITAGDSGPGLNVGDPAPAMTLTALDGAVYSLSKLKGSIIIIDFWATWCMPCIAELPQIAALHDRFKARKDVVFLGISLDGDEKTLRDFLKKRRMDWPQIYGDVGGASEAAKVFGAQYIPAVFIIGPDGRITAARIPARDIAPIVERLTPKAVTP